jgi:hypothetical protein
MNGKDEGERGKGKRTLSNGCYFRLPASAFILELLSLPLPDAGYGAAGVYPP